MITAIARKEFAEIVRDGRFKWTAAIMILLLITALTGRLPEIQRRRAHSAGRPGQTRIEQWLDQGDKNPHSAAHYGNYAFKPAGPLSYFDNGISNYTGTAVFMEAHRQNFAIGRPASDQSAIARFGDLERRHDSAAPAAAADYLPRFYGLFRRTRKRHAPAGHEHGRGTNRQLLWGKALGVGTQSSSSSCHASWSARSH